MALSIHRCGAVKVEVADMDVRDEDVQEDFFEYRPKKSSPGSSKKTAIAPDKLLKFIDPLLPPLQSCNWTGWTYLTWMAVFSERRWRQPERNNFEVGGKGESHAWIYISIGWLFFMKNPVLCSVLAHAACSDLGLFKGPVSLSCRADHRRIGEAKNPGPKAKLRRPIRTFSNLTTLNLSDKRLSLWAEDNGKNSRRG